MKTESKNYLGIYIGRQSATAVCVSLAGKEKNVSGCFNVSVEPEEGSDIQAVASLIAQGCTERKLTFSEVRVALDCALFMQHDVHSEFADPRQIASTVRFDTEEALAADVTDVAIAFRINSSGENGSQLTVFTTKKDTLSEILVALQSNNLDPVSVEPDINCLSRYISENSSFAEGQKPLYGLFSDHNGYFVIVSDKSGSGSGKSFMRTFVVSSSQDRSRLLEREIPVINALQQGGESVNCLKVFDSFKSLNCEHLSGKIRMQVSDIDLKQFVNAQSQALSDGVGDVEFAIAFGAVLAGLEKVASVNFRSDFMPYVGKKIKMLKNLRRVSISITAVFLIIGICFQVKLLQANKPRNQLRERFAKEYSAVMMGKPLPAGSNAANKLSSELRRIKNVKSGKLSVTGEQSIVSKLTLVFEAFNECASQTNLNIDKITITSKNIRIVGDTSGRKNTLKMYDAFRDKMDVLQCRYDTKGTRDGFTLTVAPKK